MNNRKNPLVSGHFLFALFLLLATSFCAQAGSSSEAVLRIPTESWVPLQTAVAQRRLFKNISPYDALSGTVIASPSRENPDYYFHWVRDAALVMEVVRQLGLEAQDPGQKLAMNNILEDYVVLSRLNQVSDAPTGLGEPKFHVDGKPFRGPWGRPQNDGPALRAVTLTEWAFDLIHQGQLNYVKTWLYRADLPAQTVIKADLEYVAQNWRNGSFDLWEEVKGDHFYTLIAQRKALLTGAALARILDDPQAAAFYESEGNLISAKLEQFWLPSKELIQPTLNRTEGLSAKVSDIDAAVLLGVLHSEMRDQTFHLHDEKVYLSVLKLVDAFANFYSINRAFPDFAPGIGRYPEDIYSGEDFNGGNPWFLTTLAVAEFYFQLSARVEKYPALLQSKSFKRFYQQSLFGKISHSQLKRDVVQRNLFIRGEQFMSRVQLHVDGQGSMAEQFHRDTGHMTSAADLTWSYASFLTASSARTRALLALAATGH